MQETEARPRGRPRKTDSLSDGLPAEKPTADQKYYCTVGFQYDAYNLEPGEIFQPLGRLNDRSLVNIEYFKEIALDYPTGYTPASCTRCGKVFVDFNYKGMHNSNCPPAEVSINEQVADLGAKVIDLDALPEFQPSNTP